MERANFSLADFEELRRRVVTATDFRHFWDYFFTNFVERPGFQSVGQAVALPRAPAVLGKVAGYMLNLAPIPAHGMMVAEVPAGIVHGSCLFDGRLGALVYVPALDTGMLAITGSGGIMHYSRFVLNSEPKTRAAAS